MKQQSSLPHSRQPVTWPYPEPDQPNLHSHPTSWRPIAKSYIQTGKLKCVLKIWIVRMCINWFSFFSMMSLRELGGELQSYREGLNVLVKEACLSYGLFSRIGWLEDHGRKWIPPGAEILLIPHDYRVWRLSISYSNCTGDKTAAAWSLPFTFTQWPCG